MVKGSKKIAEEKEKNAEGRMTPQGHCIYLLTDISGFKQTKFITYLTFLSLKYISKCFEIFFLIVFLKSRRSLTVPCNH